jgi:hypothetical protein
MALLNPLLRLPLHLRDVKGYGGLVFGHYVVQDHQ